MTEEFNLNSPANLNNPNNLNTNFIPEKRELESSEEKIVKPNKLRDEIIDNYNSDPKRDKDNVELIDKIKKRGIGRGKYYILLILALVGFLCLCIGVLGLGYASYTGKLSSSLICGNTSINIPSCSDCANSCGDCKLDCGNTTILPAAINVYINKT